MRTQKWFNHYGKKLGNFLFIFLLEYNCFTVLLLLLYIYAMEYYSAIKKNESASFIVMCIGLESVIQSEVSQKEKNKYRLLTYICNLEKGY